jgi:hypothetical protein
MNNVSASGFVVLAALLLLGACNDDAAGPVSTAGASGGGTGGLAGSASGGLAAGGVGAGTSTAGGGGAAMAGGGGGTAGASGAQDGGAAGAACDPGTGSALSFKGDQIDLVAGDLGDDLIGGNAARTLELWAHYLGDQSWLGEHSVIEVGRKVNEMPNGVFGIDMDGRMADVGRFDPYTNGVGDNGPVPLELPAEGWHHLAWAYDGKGHFQFVVDGEALSLSKPGDGTAVLATTKGVITLGGSQSFGNEGWEGELDEVRVWSSFRSVDDIKRDMRVKLKGTEPGLVAYYNLDEGSGTTADDILGRNSHKLSFCTANSANGGPCPAANKQSPKWVASTAPGPFTCAE